MQTVNCLPKIFLPTVLELLLHCVSPVQNVSVSAEVAYQCQIDAFVILCAENNLFVAQMTIATWHFS